MRPGQGEVAVGREHARSRPCGTSRRGSSPRSPRDWRDSRRRRRGRARTPRRRPPAGSAPPVVVEDRDLRARRPSHRARAALARRQRVGGHLVRRLGHAVGLDERQREAVARRPASAGPGAPRSTSARSAVHCRRARRRHPRRARAGCGGSSARPSTRSPPCVGGLLPERARREAARRDHASAGGQRRERRGDEAVDVEERHGAVARVVRSQPVGGGDRPGRGRQVALADRDALGLARGTARVQEQRDRIGVTALGRLRTRRVAVRAPPCVLP